MKSVDSRESSPRDRHPTSLASSTKVGGRKGVGFTIKLWDVSDRLEKCAEVQKALFVKNVFTKVKTKGNFDIIFHYFYIYFFCKDCTFTIPLPLFRSASGCSVIRARVFMLKHREVWPIFVNLREIFCDMFTYA